MRRSDAPPSDPSRLPIRVGFTGHRRNKLDNALLALIGPQVTAVMRTIVACSGSQVQVVSSLADGADLVVADACEALAIPMTCVIPFGVDVFRSDLPTRADRERFDYHLERARDVQIVAGSRASVATRNATYRALGEQITAQSDLIMAVWDGNPARGPGGSAEVIEQARTRHIPVLRINASQPQEVSLYLGEAQPLIGPAFDLVSRAVSK